MSPLIPFRLIRPETPPPLEDDEVRLGFDRANLVSMSGSLFEDMIEAQVGPEPEVNNEQARHDVGVEAVTHVQLDTDQAEVISIDEKQAKRAVSQAFDEAA